MLKTPAEFPHPGSTAWLEPHGEEVRILQRNADGTALVALVHRPPLGGTASDTRTVEAAHLHPRQEAAIGIKPKRRRRAA